MGTNKAFLDFNGQTLLDRALATLSAACGAVTLVGDPRTFTGRGPALADIFPGCGPLAGIHAALSHSTADLNLMLAVDMPFASPELLKLLLAIAENAESKGDQGNLASVVTIPRTSRGLQPLCAVYRPAFAPIAEQALRAGNYKIEAAFANVRLQVIDETELAAAGFSDKSFFNVNTPEDCRAARELEPSTRKA